MLRRMLRLAETESLLAMALVARCDARLFGALLLGRWPSCCASYDDTHYTTEATKLREKAS